MRPGDCITLAGAPYVLLACYGGAAAAVPVLANGGANYHRQQRGDVALDPLECGVPLRHPVARVRGLRRIEVAGAERCGGVSQVTLRALLNAARRESESRAVELKYSGARGYERMAAAERSAAA